MEIDANIAEAGSLRALFDLRDILRPSDRMFAGVHDASVRIFDTPDDQAGRPRINLQWH